MRHEDGAQNRAQTLCYAYGVHPIRPALRIFSFVLSLVLLFTGKPVFAAERVAASGADTGAAFITLPSGLKLEPKTCLAAPGREQDIAVAEDTAPGELVDPLFHHTGYIGAVGGWVFEDGSWQERFRACYEKGGRALALEVAELLARFYCYGKTRLRFGQVTREIKDTAFLDIPQKPHEVAPPTNFYLDNEDMGGGKEQDGALYIFQASQPRHPVELAREVAHEFSHLTVPGIRGFGPPEDWTNGYLGEVLYLSWLSEDTGESVIPGDEVDAWSAGRRDALIKAFLRSGPGPLIDRPTGHFWAFEGMLLYLKQTHGLPLLSRLLEISADSKHGRPTADDWQLNLGYAMSGFSTAAHGTDGVLVDGKYAAEVTTDSAGVDRQGGHLENQWTFQKLESGLMLPPGGAARCWIYLRRGHFKLIVTADGTGWLLRGASLDPTSHYWMANVSSAASTVSFNASSEAWYHLQWRNTGSEPIRIQEWRWIPTP